MRRIRGAAPPLIGAATDPERSRRYRVEAWTRRNGKSVAGIAPTILIGCYATFGMAEHIAFSGIVKRFETIDGKSARRGGSLRGACVGRVTNPIDRRPAPRLRVR